MYDSRKRPLKNYLSTKIKLIIQTNENVCEIRQSRAMNHDVFINITVFFLLFSLFWILLKFMIVTTIVMNIIITIIVKRIGCKNIMKIITTIIIVVVRMK